MSTQQDLFAPAFVPSVYQEALFQEIQNGSEHVLVRAVAGSGKTTTITRAIEFIPKDQSVLLCAFNKEICKTLEKKVKREADVETFHAIGFQAVRRAWGRSISIDRLRDKTVMLQSLESLELDHEPFTRYQLSQLISLAKSYLAWKDEQLSVICAQHGLQVEEEYFRAVRRSLLISGSNTGTVSFDDMIYAPIYAKMPLNQYHVVLIDETQDLNYAQWMLAKRSLLPSGRIIAVGDQRQAIYQFRGARPNAMIEAEQDLCAKSMPLSVTYRCPKSVVFLAQKYVPEIEAAPHAIEGQVRVVDLTVLWEEVCTGDLILSRTNSRLISLCLKAIRRKIPSRILGKNLSSTLLDLIEQSEKTTIEDLLTWLEQYKDRESKRLMALNMEENIEELLDKIASIRALCEGLSSVVDLQTRIETLCIDSPKEDAVLFSSVHRAKGLETNRVWVAQDTFRLESPNPARRAEEENLFYVAVTRAKRELSLFSGADLPE